MVGLKEENVDVVYIGGSSAFQYWQPYHAWNDYGITSYLFAVDNLQAESVLSCVKEAEKTQHPDLFIIDARPFQYWLLNDGQPAGLRNMADGLDLSSVNRTTAIYRYLKNRGDDGEGPLSWFLDLFYYHTHYENLASPTAWALTDNREAAPYKGWEFHEGLFCIDTPTDFQSEIRADLPAEDAEALNNLLDYCTQQQLQVLFVVCPYAIEKEDQEVFNSIMDAVNARGYLFINSNNYYEELGINFETDFYNYHHTNVLGAEKYTDFLEKLIVNTYNLKDHRGEDSYNDWATGYQRYAADEARFVEAACREADYLKEGLELAPEMQNTTNFSEWYDLANDQRYTIFLVQEKECPETNSIAEKDMITKWGLSNDTIGRIEIIANDEVLLSNQENLETKLEGTLGSWNELSYLAELKNDGVSVEINGKEAALPGKGLHAVVINNYYRTVMDSVILSSDGNRIVIQR